MVGEQQQGLVSRHSGKDGRQSRSEQNMYGSRLSLSRTEWKEQQEFRVWDTNKCQCTFTLQNAAPLSFFPLLAGKRQRRIFNGLRVPGVGDWSASPPEETGFTFRIVRPIQMCTLLFLCLVWAKSLYKYTICQFKDAKLKPLWGETERIVYTVLKKDEEKNKCSQGRWKLATWSDQLLLHSESPLLGLVKF